MLSVFSCSRNRAFATSESSLLAWGTLFQKSFYFLKISKKFLYLVDCVASGVVCGVLAIVSEGFLFRVESSCSGPKVGVVVSKLVVTGYKVVGVRSCWKDDPLDPSKEDGPGLSKAVSVVKSSDCGKVAIEIEKRSPSEINYVNVLILHAG